MSIGTIRSKVVAGVRRSNQLPRAPPPRDGTIRRSSQRRSDLSSWRKPKAPASEPGQSATELVALATMASRPIQRRAGNDTMVPPPAMTLSTTGPWFVNWTVRAWVTPGHRTVEAACASAARRANAATDENAARILSREGSVIGLRPA
jgi:hypothetical protein